LPISKGIAGVSMRLEPGVMRELHWHATAAEWAFVIEGRVRTTVVDPQGYAETNDFDPGDVWYFPRGHGHMLQCLGDQPCQFILIFDNGYFSEFGTFSITDWIGHTPKPLLAKNFGLPEAAFDRFPKEEVYFASGGVEGVKLDQARARPANARSQGLTREINHVETERFSGLLPAKGSISSARDEYYSVEMYKNLLAARDHGVNVAFLSGDTCCGIIPFQPNSRHAPHRTITRTGYFTPFHKSEEVLRQCPEMKKFTAEQFGPCEDRLTG